MDEQERTGRAADPGTECADADTDARAGSHRGRVLDASRDVALREAALELLTEIGYDRLTMDAVATRAHASKSTIYRRWQGKAELVVDALTSRKGLADLPDTGSLEGDLAALGKRSSSTDSKFDAQVMLGLITALAHDADLRRVFRERLIDPRMRSVTEIFERAVSRGEMPPDRNLELLGSLYPALLIQHLLVTGEVPDAAFTRQVVHDLILPLATAPVRPSAVSRGRTAGPVGPKEIP